MMPYIEVLAANRACWPGLDGAVLDSPRVQARRLDVQCLLYFLRGM